MAKPDNCEISIDKQNKQSGVSNENNATLQGSNNIAAGSNPFPAALEVLARNKPILDVLSVTCLVLIIASIGVVVCLVVLFGKSPPKTNTVDMPITDRPLRIVTRNEWLAQPPRDVPSLLELPVHNVIIAHTATEECVTPSQCVAMVNRIQQFHMAPDTMNFSDIVYNFLVGTRGNIYEGRGWDKQGAHTRGFNKDSICIAFIGTFTDVEAPELQLRAARQLIAMGVEQGVIDPHYRLYAHRQLAPYESPGDKLFEQIKTWPHWSNKVGPSHWCHNNCKD